MSARATTLFTTALLSGCIGVRNVEPDWLNPDTVDEEEGGGTNNGGGAEEVEVDEGCDEEEIDRSTGFSIEGTVYDIDLDDIPADPESLCAYALDPSPVLSGGDPVYMAGSQVCPNGDYVVTGLSDPPSIGMFISIDDCEGNPDTVMRSATGVDFDDVKDLENGESHTGFRAYLINNEFAAAIGDDLVGFDGDVLETGFMAGFVRDIDENPVDGAELACGSCVSFYYLDTDWDDGLFETSGTLNTQTDIEADSMFVAPSAPIFTYEASDGGNHSWDPQLFGSLPGYASFLLFNAL
jgi:hypothetical protein